MEKPTSRVSIFVCILIAVVCVIVVRINSWFREEENSRVSNSEVVDNTDDS